MPTTTVNHRRVPGCIGWADIVTIAIAVLAAAVIATGGWRFPALGGHVSLRSGWRLLGWAAVVAGIRQLAWRRPSLPARIVAWVAARRLSPGAAARWGGEFLAAPYQEAKSGRDGLRRLSALAASSRRALAAAVVLVVMRSLVFVWWEQAAFNSDHAIVGLMAKHLAEGRAFPLFFYGQSYMLGVEAWLAAPVFLVFGPSVFGLQLPLLVLNAAVAALLVLLLRLELGLGQWRALAASLFFVLAPPATSLRLVEANGGSVEPLLYVLLLWMLRRRPGLFGIVLAFGFLHREFTLYGLFALLVLWALAGRASPAWRLRGPAVAAGWFALVWLAVQALQLVSSPFGPGTGVASLGATETNVAEALRRSCWSAERLLPRLVAMWTSHLPVLFGTEPRSLGRLGIRSVLAGQGTPFLGLVMAASLTVATLGVAGRCWRARPKMGDIGFALFLSLTGVFSMGGYWALSCHRITPDTLRYDLLGLYAAVGLAALFFRLMRSRVATALGLASIVLWSAVSAASHGRLLAEYVADPPPDFARAAVDRLLADRVECARGNYWIAYRFTFLAGERLVVAADAAVRIQEYQRRAESLGDAVRKIQDAHCDAGSQLAGPFYLCPAGRPSP